MTDNVLLVTVDSLRYDYTGISGSSKELTPFLDELGDTGSVFHNAYAHVGGTRMSFPTILASSTPLMYGGYEEISDDQTLISESFNDAEYATGGFHSNLYLSADFEYDRGYDTFFDSRGSTTLDTRLRQFVTSHLEETPIYPVLKKLHSVVESTGGINVGSYIVPADNITDLALEWAEAQTATQNFLWIHYMDPHHPYLPPNHIREQFVDEPITDREALKLRRRALEEPDTVDEQDIGTLKQLYEGEVYFTDQEIRRLVENIREMWDETVVAVTADHGEQFDEHGRFRGDPLYEEMTHVPLIIDNWADDGDHDSLVGLTDLAPSLLDYMGIEIPDSYAGESLRHIIDGDEWNREHVIGGFAPHEEPIFTYRSSQWRFISRPDGTEELYNVQDDPKEQHNVIGEHPTVEAEIREDLKTHREIVSSDGWINAEMDEEIRQRLRNLGYKE